jgi:hypothetical protein
MKGLQDIPKGLPIRSKERVISKLAELTNPAGNNPLYQESVTFEGSGDLLNYAEPWGGPQNRPYAIPGQSDLESDPPMTRQGERPPTYINATPPEVFPVDSTVPGGADLRTPSGGTKDEQAPNLIGDRDANPVPRIGERNDYYGVEPNFGSVYVYATNLNEEGVNMKRPSKAMVEKVVKTAYEKGYSLEETAAPHRIKLASLEDLYAFERVSAETLIHKSSRELWSISEDEDGVVIEKNFKDGAAVKA